MSQRILVLAGTAAPGAPVAALAAEAARRLALTTAEVTLVGLADYALPLFDAGADEAEVPDAAVKLAGRIAAQDGLLLVSPEASGSLPPLVKNALDWTALARRGNGRPLQPYRRLVVALAGASTDGSGAGGALRALRPVLRLLGAEVMGDEMRLVSGGQAFDERGRLANEADGRALDALLDRLVLHATALGRQAS